MFSKIYKVLNNIANLDYNKIMREVWSDENVQEFIIKLNTEDQLFDKGVDSDNKDLGDYAPFTVEKKKLQGLPYDRITLFDSGDFYGSFDVIPNNEGFKITADPVKESSNLFQDFGEQIVGLTAESKQKLRDRILEVVINEIRYEITRN